MNGTKKKEQPPTLQGVHAGQWWPFLLWALKQPSQGNTRRRCFLLPDSCCLHAKVLKLLFLEDILGLN